MTITEYDAKMEGFLSELDKWREKLSSGQMDTWNFWIKVQDIITERDNLIEGNIPF